MEPALELGPGIKPGVFPYEDVAGKLAFLWERILLRLLGRRAYPGVSIVPAVAGVFGLAGEKELLARYEGSRHGIQELWQSADRERAAAAESFYDEHDADLWRQAFRSHFIPSYKAKLLVQARIVRRLAGSRRDLAVLDYGCGAGVLVHRLLADGFQNVHIADIPSPTLRFCRQAFGDRLRSAQEVGSGRALAGRFDVITCLDCLEHTVDPLRIATELVEALEPGGALVVSYPLETDFSFSHTRAAAEARPAVMEYLNRELEPLLSQRVFRKRN